MTPDTRDGPAARIPPRRVDTLLSSLAERVGGTFAHSTVFGSPTSQDGVTVIPVASGRFLFGGGGGGDTSKAQSGEGGGAVGVVSPRGFIELTDGASRFVPIVHPGRRAAIAGAMVAAGAVAVRLAGSGHRRNARANR